MKLPKYYARPRMRYAHYNSWKDERRRLYVLAGRTETGAWTVLQEIPETAIAYGSYKRFKQRPMVRGRIKTFKRGEKR